MNSVSLLQCLHVWSDPGCLFLTLSALCRSLRHCFSSVASESSVPIERNIMLKRMICGTCLRQARTQLGKRVPSVLSVRKRVTLCTVRSDSFRGLSSRVLCVKDGCHPIFRGNATVMGPMIECCLGCIRSHMSLTRGLPYSGLGMVGVSSHDSTGSMSSSEVGVIIVPVGWGLLCLSRKISSYVGGRPVVFIRAYLGSTPCVVRATMSPTESSDGAGMIHVRLRCCGSWERMLIMSL